MLLTNLSNTIKIVTNIVYITLLYRRTLQNTSLALRARTQVHRSKTCEVVFAEDVKASSSGRMVAIKMMKDRYQWKCEIQARQEYELDSCVVKLVGWHAPQGEDTFNGRTWC